MNQFLLFDTDHFAGYVKNENLYMRIKVSCKACKNSFGKLFSDLNSNLWLCVYVTQAPVDGAANKSIIEMIAKKLKISKNSIEIESGIIAKYKILKISKVSNEVVKKYKEICYSYFW